MNVLPPRGRGTASNPHNRFAPTRSEAEHSDWYEEDVPPSRATEVRSERARTVISYNRSPDVGFERSVNPYRGCEHGCIYCFARPSHAYWDLSPGIDFETRLIAKTNLADVLEELQAQLNSLSQHIFSETRERAQEKADLQRVIKDLGRYNSLLAKLNESLLSIGRQITYVRQAGNGWLSEAARTWLKSSERDVRSLNDYQTKMSGEIVFLLDVTLGLINIEQNSIIKVFSIAAVLFLPPTLVGTVYGMNFKAMPELDWTLGYPMALGMMVGSALLSYALFKYKGWL